MNQTSAVGQGSRGTGRGPRATAALLLALGALALALPSAAAAAGPKATTGGAKGIGYGSATVNGTVNPGGAATSYYFQYGPTRAYGGQSTIGSAGAGDKGVPVSVGLGGLQPLTVYHYRLVAVNGAGVSLGDDRTFQTTKVPLSLAIAISPKPVVWGAPVVIQGTLAGTGNAGRKVVLLGRPFPFTGPFAQIGNPELTTATGGFSFTLLGDADTAEFQVVTTTNPPSRAGSRPRTSPSASAAIWRARGAAVSCACSARSRPPRTAPRSASCGSRTATVCSSAAPPCAITPRRARASAAWCVCTRGSTGCSRAWWAHRRCPTTVSRC